MPKTRQDLATAVLKEIRVLAAGDTPDNVDAEYVKDIYADKFFELEDMGLVYWTAPEDGDDNTAVIPDVVYRLITRIIGAEVAPAFGVNYNPGNALIDLRTHISKEITGQPVRAVYF